MAKPRQDARPDGAARTASRGGTLGSKRRAPDEARRSILAAAERLFYHDGIGAVGVDAIAEAARVTKRTLYYHFASKDELISAYLEARDEVTLQALCNTPTDRGTRPGDRILGVFDYVEHLAATTEWRGCPFNNAVAEQGTGPQVAAIARRHKATMRSWFAELAAEGGARHADEVGTRLLVLLDGALNGTAVFGSPDAAAVARSMVEALLDTAGVARSKTKAERK